MRNANKLGRHSCPVSIQGIVFRSSLVLGCLCAIALHEPVAAKERVFYIQAIEHKGKTHISSEPFPSNPLTAAPGMKVKMPQSDGNWSVESYGFSPAEITVMQGDLVILRFIGVNGARHSISIEGVNPFIVTRGTTTEVQFKVDMPGLFEMRCLDHQPNMTGQIVVLPKQ